MANNPNIIIEFKPKGDAQLIAAIKQMDIATKRLEGKISEYEKETRKADESTRGVSLSTIFATKSMRNMGGATMSFTRIISRFRSKMLLASFAIGGFIHVVQKRIDLYKEQIQAETALESNLRNVQDNSEAAAESLKAYASELQNVTTFGDEQIISAMSLLSTFQLNSAAIKEIIPNLLDMTASTGTLEGNTIALGKAFTGQVGVLGRYGVVIDKAQLAQERQKGTLEEFKLTSIIIQMCILYMRNYQTCMVK